MLFDSVLYGKSPSVFHKHVDGHPRTFVVVTVTNATSKEPLVRFGGYSTMA